MSEMRSNQRLVRRISRILTVVTQCDAVVDGERRDPKRGWCPRGMRRGDGLPFLSRRIGSGRGRWVRRRRRRPSPRVALWRRGAGEDERGHGRGRASPAADRAHLARYDTASASSEEVALSSEARPPKMPRNLCAANRLQHRYGGGRGMAVSTERPPSGSSPYTDFNFEVYVEEQSRCNAPDLSDSVPGVAVRLSGARKSK